jgi:hypothetical protein
MFDPAILIKARLEVTRLNRELHALHLEEERCKLRRSRLEGEHSRDQALVDMCELAQRLVEKPLEPYAGPSYHIEEHHGAKLVIVDKPAQPSTVAPSPPSARSTLKPEGLPSVRKMVLGAIEDAAGRGITSLRPREITAFVRRKWWPSVRGSWVSSVTWKMAQKGELRAGDGKYGLSHKANGATGDAASDHWEDLYA